MHLLHSTILGNGRPLLILHGFLGMSDNWKTLGKQYTEAGFQVHLIDQRNHGKSFHSNDFDYDLLASDLKAYIDAHQIVKPILLGHSMGGKTVMQFATTYPDDTIEKLIVADIAPKYYPPHHQEIINALLTLNFDLIKSRSDADRTLAEQLSDFGIRQFLLKNLYWKEKKQLGFRFNLSALKDKMEEIGEGIDPMSSYTGPTLFLRGEHSDYILPNDTENIMKNFPNAKIETVSGAGHWLHAEKPKEFLTKSLNFINQ